MKPALRRACTATTGAILVVGMLLLGFWLAPRPAPLPLGAPPTSEKKAPRLPAPSPPPAPAARAEPKPASVTPPAGLPVEKAARVEKIKRDYDEVRARVAAEYAAAGASFPGGLNGFLRQLALLEREKRVDLAAVLSPRELEDLELRDTTAGQTVQRLLGDTDVDDDRRRAVFRLQLEFDDRFGLTFDVSPPALLERERARREMNEQIRATLGDGWFAAWLRGEGADFAPMAELAAQQQLPPSASVELWRAKNEFALRHLEITTAPGLTAQQRRAARAILVQQTEIRLMGILGGGAVQLARDGVFQWLPKP
jgi:hypothetical protein